MNKFIYNEWVKLESARHEIERIVIPVSEKDFQAAAANKWSIAQILVHVVTSEKLARLYMTKKSQGIVALRNSGILQSAKLALLKVSQRLPVKYKVPKAIQAKTPDPPGKNDLIDSWRQERADQALP